MKTTMDDIKKLDAHKFKVAVSDIDGILRGKYLHRDKFLSTLKSGAGFCNVIFGWDMGDVCYDNADYTGWHTGYPDTQVQIDLNTFRKIPWEHNTPFFLGDFLDANNKPLSLCPRQTLKRVIKKAEDLGFVLVNGMEFEWFNFFETPKTLFDKKYTSPEPISPGMFGYSLLRASQQKDFFNAIFDELGNFGVPIEGLHTETGPGVLEAAILYSDALENADRAILFKAAVKEIGHRFGIMPSFMAKWSATLPGCSGHMHQSLWNLDRTKNLFFDDKNPLKMSKTAEHFMAGQLHCLEDLLPFFAPNVNSYKRLVDGFWAPTKTTWGVDNRTTALRWIPGSAASTRVEMRLSGSDVNPYLSIAASLAAGLYGIEHKIKLTDKPVVGSAYKAGGVARLPCNLQEATQKLAESKIARKILGENLVNHFVQTREWEWRQFQNSVTNWEIQRYFEII